MTDGASDLEFIHRFVAAETPDKIPLLLLHGTGGNESDLIPLGLRLSPGAALLSPRGKVSEQGMPRFFRRRAEGVFDLDDLSVRTDELAGFLADARVAYGLAKPIAVGFSNGANIGWSLLLRHPTALAGAILMRAMLPFEVAAGASLTGVPVLLLSGAADPIVSAQQRERLATALAASGADVRHEVLHAGHQLTQEDVALASAWLAQR